MAPELGDLAVKHLSELIRIDTTNPPGNETPAAEYLAGLFAGAGIEPRLVGADPRRMNVVARLPGDGSKPPLLLAAHLDVVPVERDKWRHDPFGGEIHDGYLWGRGAIDMKQMAVMSTLVAMRLAEDKVPLARDVIFAGVADEEAGCDLGSKWLVDHHPELVRAEYALGEAGGFTVHLNGQQLYPIGIAEKGVVWMKLRVSGSPGHGSVPRDDNAVGRLGAIVHRLATTPLPHHRTKVVDRYLEALARTQRFPLDQLLKRMHVPVIAQLVLSRLPDRGAANALRAVLSNTATPTMLRAGDKVNVVPGHAEAFVDGRTLPGETAAGLIAEIKKVAEDDVDIEILKDMPPVETTTDTPLWRVIGDVMAKEVPDGRVVPMLMPGFTDAKQWSRLGTKCYGFMPTRFPDDGTRFSDLFHGHDERIPVEGLKWGVEVLYETVRRFAGR
ncbi:MAG: M20/M25/M40 family metallo-hydrolase [Deltaproteobacteria bacterium]|nr:M20/M25/M40 family metallo-hydrolase [Deltaproteobacteria bacterium]